MGNKIPLRVLAVLVALLVLVLVAERLAQCTGVG